MLERSVVIVLTELSITLSHTNICLGHNSRSARRQNQRVRNSRKDVIEICRELDLNPDNRKEREKALKELWRRKQAESRSPHRRNNSTASSVPNEPDSHSQHLSEEWLLQQIESGCVSGMARAMQQTKSKSVVHGKRSDAFF